MRSQISPLIRLAERWLVECDGPPMLDRLVIDRCIRSAWNQPPNGVRPHRTPGEPSSHPAVVRRNSSASREGGSRGPSAAEDGQRHQCQGDALVRGSAGLPLPGGPSAWTGSRQRGRSIPKGRLPRASRRNPRLAAEDGGVWPPHAVGHGHQPHQHPLRGRC